MTFGEIYNAVVFNVWGDAVPPTGSVARLQGEEGIIVNMAQSLQKDYNYWFMEMWTVIDSVAGSQGYMLPTDFKELINCMWTVVDATATDTYFTEPLKVLSHGEAHVRWRDNNERTEYPGYFEIQSGNSLVLYPIPEFSDRELVAVFYRFLSRPTDAQFTDAENEITTHGAEAIIALSTARMFRILQELNMSTVFDREAQREIELLKYEDVRRRQILLHSVNYRGF